MSEYFVNKRKPMKEISSEQVEKIEAKYGGGWFYLVKVIIEPYQGSEKFVAPRIEWWKVHREAHNFERRMVAHAPTKKLAMEQLEELRNSQWKSFKNLYWHLSPEDQTKCHEIEAELKKIENQEKEAQVILEIAKAEKKKKLAAARRKRYKERKKQKERVEFVKKISETDRFTGIEI